MKEGNFIIENQHVFNLSLQGVTNIASISLQIGYPTMASAPHSIVNGFKNLLAIAVETEISFKEAETVSELS